METRCVPKTAVPVARARVAPVVHVDEAVRHDAGTYVAVASASLPLPPSPVMLVVRATRRVAAPLLLSEERITRRLAEVAARRIQKALDMELVDGVIVTRAVDENAYAMTIRMQGAVALLREACAIGSGANVAVRKAFAATYAYTHCCVTRLGPLPREQHVLTYP
jgi:hypothetical protein